MVLLLFWRSTAITGVPGSLSVMASTAGVNAGSPALARLTSGESGQWQGGEDCMRKVTIPKSKFMIWLRTWNPSWFVNPFYSPSVAGYVAGAKFIRDMMLGIEYATSFFSAFISIQDAVDKKGDDDV